MALQSLLPAIVNRFRPLPETSHALDLCQSHEAHPHLKSRMTRPISSNRRNAGANSERDGGWLLRFLRITVET